jgi:hypothetical protein
MPSSILPLFIVFIQSQCLPSWQEFFAHLIPVPFSLKHCCTKYLHCFLLAPKVFLGIQGPRAELMIAYPLCDDIEKSLTW